MNFALNDDHIMLRDSAQVFVDRETSLKPLLVPGASVDASDYADNWRKICELGWPGIIIPESYGGSGLNCIDLMMILEELGRTLMPAPLLGHLLGIWALCQGGSETQRERVLPQAALGEITLALVGQGDGNSIIAEDSAGGMILRGEHAFVVDAVSADMLVVAAKHSATGKSSFYLVDAKQAGVEIHLQPWRDITRQVCAVSFADASAEALPGDGDDLWAWVRDRACFALAAESVGGMRHVLKQTAEYAKERVAFGRPIGAYQGIKHPLADMLGQVECANTITLYAAWALSHDTQEAAAAAAMAKAYVSEAYVSATHRSIQIFGAIGFTWEMENHLYFKRARANAEMFGNAYHHRERVVAMATGKRWPAMQESAHGC